MAKPKQQQEGLLSLFDDPTPPTAHVPGIENMKPETQQALGVMIRTAIAAADRVSYAYCFYCNARPPAGPVLPEGWCWDTDEPDNYAAFCPLCQIPMPTCERCGGPMRFTEFGESECFEDCDEPAPEEKHGVLRALTRAFGDERDKMMHDGLEEGRAAFEMNDDPEWIRKMVEVEETTGGYIGAGRSFYTSFDFDETPVTEASTAPCDQPGFWANKLKEMGEMRLLAARSFIEFARRSGIEHTAVVPTGTDNNGQRAYDFDAVTRLANKMRGRPESNKPELKTEGDWQEAIEGVKLWRAIQKVDQLVKNGKIPSR